MELKFCGDCGRMTNHFIKDKVEICVKCYGDEIDKWWNLK